MTLAEIIELRQKKFKKEPCSEWWEGYKSGWYWAYEDLKEILEQNGFDMDVVVIGTTHNEGIRKERPDVCKEWTCETDCDGLKFHKCLECHRAFK